MIFNAFFALMVLFTVTDLYNRTIPNMIIIPAIVISVIATHNYVPMAIMLLIGLYLASRAKYSIEMPLTDILDRSKRELYLKHCPFRGGDIKLLMLCGACLGYLSIACFIVSFLFVKIYRLIKNDSDRLAYAPFITLASFMVISGHLAMYST